MAREAEILEANERDLEAGRADDLSTALMDRLKLTPERLAGIAADVRGVAALPDPVGEVIRRPADRRGARHAQVREPLGVVAVVYEARPNVTIDCSALCLKSRQRDRAARVVERAALERRAGRAWPPTRSRRSGCRPASVSIVAGGDRDELRQLATQDGVVDLIIPRGGEGLKNA